jgi:gamma-glutamyltranspeptidase/glutathione hydrolase
VIDGEGLAVALTTTINTSFGSEVVAPRSGILLNNEMDDFMTKPGQPNAFGLVQSEANAIVPGHRPLSSMTPTILMDASGQNMISVGGSGGPFIITETYQALRNVLDHAMGAQAAVAAPRWHHQWQPNMLLIDTEHPARLELLEAGHEMKDAPDFPAAQIVVLKNGTFDAGADPRKGGLPAIVQ